MRDLLYGYVVCGFTRTADNNFRLVHYHVSGLNQTDGKTVEIGPLPGRVEVSLDIPSSAQSDVATCRLRWVGGHAEATIKLEVKFRPITMGVWQFGFDERFEYLNVLMPVVP